MLLTKEADGDGAILSRFNEFSHKNVNGVIWCPGNQAAFALSKNELVLLRIWSESLENLDELNQSFLGFEMFHGMNAFWGKTAKNQRPFLLLGEGVKGLETNPSQVTKIYFQ